MDATELARHVQAVVDAAPPLNPSQRAVIRALLAPQPRPTNTRPTARQ
jgi:hypothetical protein